VRGWAQNTEKKVKIAVNIPRLNLSVVSRTATPQKERLTAPLGTNYSSSNGALKII